MAHREVGEVVSGAMRVSVIIPVWNAAAHVRCALNSAVLACRPLTAAEIICVDDGSTDGSATILDDYAAREAYVRVLHLPHRGVSAARNAALDVATGDFVAFLDADDALHPACLSLALSAAARHPGKLIAWGWQRKGAETFVPLAGAVAEDERSQPGANGPCVWNRLYPRALIANLRFDPSLTVGEDRVFLLALEQVRGVQTVRLDAELYFYRVSPASSEHRPLRREDFVQRQALVEAELRVFGADEEARLNYCRQRLFGQLKLFSRQLRRVVPEERAAARQIFVRMIRALRTRGYFVRPRGSFTDLCRYVCFLATSWREG